MKQFPAVDLADADDFRKELVRGEDSIDVQVVTNLHESA